MKSLFIVRTKKWLKALVLIVNIVNETKFDLWQKILNNFIVEKYKILLRHNFDIQEYIVKSTVINKMKVTNYDKIEKQMHTIFRENVFGEQKHYEPNHKNVSDHCFYHFFSIFFSAVLYCMDCLKKIKSTLKKVCIYFGHLFNSFHYGCRNVILSPLVISRTLENLFCTQWNYHYIAVIIIKPYHHRCH